jgi:hypothetical protein
MIAPAWVLADVGEYTFTNYIQYVILCRKATVLAL